jgi:hypothetical protein
MTHKIKMGFTYYLNMQLATIRLVKVSIRCFVITVRVMGET